MVCFETASLRSARLNISTPSCLRFDHRLSSQNVRLHVTTLNSTDETLTKFSLKSEYKEDWFSSEFTLEKEMEWIEFVGREEDIETRNEIRPG